MANEEQKTVRHQMFDDVRTMVKANVAAFLVGPAGTGKTTIAKNVAAELDLKFRYAGSVESAFQLRGFVDAHGNLVKTPFRDAYENGYLFLFDELDASDAQAIVTVHSALDNDLMDCPDKMVPRHPDFRFLAAGNTWGHGASLDYIGRNALDGATLDRYSFVRVDYDTALEAHIAKQIGGEHAMRWTSIVQQAREAVGSLQLRHIVSTRAVRDGLKLINAGMSVGEVFQRQVLKGLSEDEVVKVKEKIDFQTSELAERINPAPQQIQDISEMLADVDRLLEFVQSAHEFIGKHRKTIERVERSKTEVEESASHMITLADDLKNRHNELSTVIDKLDVNVTSAENSVADINSRNNIVTENLNRFTELEESVERIQKELLASIESLSTKRDEADTLSGEMATTAKDMIAAIAEAAEALATIKNLTRQLKSLESPANEFVSATKKIDSN